PALQSCPAALGHGQPEKLHLRLFMKQKAVLSCRRRKHRNGFFSLFFLDFWRKMQYNNWIKHRREDGKHELAALQLFK
ncbi:MAG: hypothetical protein IKL85_00710, partial [Lentisphaeria bacterium]|nr:hypothetical protein [Lentisphaeria bacterium]